MINSMEIWKGNGNITTLFLPPRKTTLKRRTSKHYGDETFQQLQQLVVSSILISQSLHVLNSNIREKHGKCFHVSSSLKGKSLPTSPIERERATLEMQDYGYKLAPT